VAFLLVDDASAIPTRDPHTHVAGATTWAQNPIPANDPDTTNHQHNSTLDIRGSNGMYDGYAVWDSELITDGARDMWRFPGGVANNSILLGVEARTFGHGYIADDTVSAIEYSFVGAGWNDDNKQLVRDAFAEWETQAKTRANGTTVGQGGALVRRANTLTGINFDEDTLFTQTNFEIRWANIGGTGLAAQWFPGDTPNTFDPTGGTDDLDLIFNTNTLFNSSGTNTGWNSDPETGEWDFYSTALHEIGHVLGLHHFAAGDKSNLMSATVESFQKGQKHRFIDTADLQGAVDLYSIWVPEPAGAVMALLAMGWTSLRRRSRSAGV
jgi:hypothetical protein